MKAQSLRDWCSQNGEYGEQLLKEWHTDKNNHLYLCSGETPDTIARASGQKVWWKCSECSHEWQATVLSRTSLKSGCPSCGGNICITGKNDLQTWCLSQGDFGQQLLKEWNTEKNNELGFTPTPFQEVVTK